MRVRKCITCRKNRDKKKIQGIGGVSGSSYDVNASDA